MHQVDKFAREPQISMRNLRKLDCAARLVPTFADRARSGFLSEPQSGSIAG